MFFGLSGVRFVCVDHANVNRPKVFSYVREYLAILWDSTTVISKSFVQAIILSESPETVRITAGRDFSKIHMVCESQRIFRALNSNLLSPLCPSPHHLCPPPHPPPPSPSLGFLLVVCPWLGRWWGMLLLWLRGIQGGSDSSTYTHTSMYTHASMRNTDRCVADCIVETLSNPHGGPAAGSQFLSGRSQRNVLLLSIQILCIVANNVKDNTALYVCVCVCVNSGANCSSFMCCSWSRIFPTDRIMCMAESALTG